LGQCRTMDGRSFPARIEQGHVVDLSPALEVSTVSELLRAGLLPDAAVANGPQIGRDSILFGGLCDDRTHILCAGMNFASHAKEAGRVAPEHPNFFIRYVSSLVAAGEPIVCPAVSHYFDWEGEVAVVIGSTARAVSEADAMDLVAGFTLFGDHSIRDFQLHGQQATAGKNFDRTGSVGPWIVTRDEIELYAAVAFETRVNGVVMQSATLADLVHGIPRLLAYITSFMTVEPGDIVALGTPPGIGARREPPIWLRPGDEVEIYSPQLGLLRNTVIGEEIA
jgi:2-keto-4-pentenoate hydratase/2-oxohepta-3-ene-1,7-dioic acid hydratase in catechol pathway